MIRSRDRKLRATEGSALIELSRHVFETLRRDEDSILYRGRNHEDLSQVLVLAPAKEEASPERLKRLEHEYSFKADLDPSWAARPIEIGFHWNRPVLVLEDPGGIPLDQLLGQVPDLGASLRRAISLANAIGQLHWRGIVHKDIKPANVLVNSATDTVRLMGFGIASRLPRERQPPDAPEFIAGTLAYMAPEQTGRMNRSTDSRSDLYSYGVTLYEMLTGLLPFIASDAMEWVHCHVARRPTPPDERTSGIPPIVSSIVMKLLSKTAEERYQTAAGVESDLSRCLGEWEKLGRVHSFSLGTHDVSDRLWIPERLYGRDHQVKVLLDAFERVVTGEVSRLALVSGFSGIGKSSVVNELQKAIVSPRGIFIAGKFDQHWRDIPYATLAQAFQTLVRQILSKSEDQVDQWRQAIRQAVGPSGQLIASLIPELELIIGKQPPVPELPSEETQNRFQAVFRRFLCVFAQKEHPLTLFLDDLQWLDVATLNFIEHLLSHPDVKHLLIVGAYRDNEVSPSHPLIVTLDLIRKAGVIVDEIVLKPLSFEDVNHFIADALRCERVRSENLARLVHEKTAGNPFFVIQFLTALAEEHLVAFDARKTVWQWDLNQINTRGFTDNVVELMAVKLKRFSDTTQEVLKQLACLGNIAEIATLALVYGETEEAVHAALWEAVHAGLVFREDSAYKFLHDRVQEAAYALIPKELRARLHLRIGRSLIAKMNQDEIEDKIFDIVSQLNSGRLLISDLHEKDLVAGLNLRAGTKAKASAAYDSACIYLSSGMELMDYDAWERRYDLAFRLWLERAESEYLNGRFDEAEGLIAELLDRARSKVDKVAAYRLRILLQLMKAEYRQAIDSGLECFRLFGIEMPAHPTREDVQVEYERIRQKLGSRSIESLIDLPLMTDPEMQAAMAILSVIAAAAFNTDINLMYLFFCQMVNASLEYGTTGASAHGYAELATILGPVFHRYLDGYRFGKLACRLIEKYGFNTYKTKVYFCMQRAMLWTQPIRSAIDFTRRAIDAGVETHDMVFACFSWHHLVTGLLLQGVRLDDVWHESQNGMEFVRKVKFREEDGIVRCQQRFILAVRGETAVTAGVADDQFDEQSFETDFAAARKPFMAFHYWTLKLQAAYILGEQDAAMLAARKARGLLWSAEQHIQSVDYYYYSALTAAALYEATAAEKRFEMLELVEQSLKWLREWLESCRETFHDKYTLVSAELARIEGRELDTMRLYEDAIHAARNHGFVQNEAIGNELAAKFYLDRRYGTIAQAYLRNARYCYLRWGALGKVKQLNKRYPKIEEQAAVRPTTTIGTSVEQLDLGAVMKASHAVSGEIVLEKLIKTLMVIALEHAGAERGFLILSHGEELQVAAEAGTGREEVEVYLQQAPITAADLPDSLLRYVMRTQESVILDDALVRNNLFSEDEYFRQQRARSVLCLPLIKQAKLMGVLYLENNLAPGVFTTMRLAMLELLASQAAISLDHARLYADLIQENNDRKKAEEALRVSEERWSMLAENTSAGIALTAPNGRFIAANLALQKMLGYTEEELQERAISDISYEEDRAATMARIAEAEEGKRRVYRLEKRYLRKDGRVMWADVSSVFVPASGSVSAFFSVVIIDITKRKRAEEELQQKEISLREAQNELAHVSRVTTMGELAASIAHEVNQPLAGIVMNANASLRWMAGDSPNLAEAREAIRRIIRDGNRAGNVISRMRALLKKASAAKEPVEINEVIQEVLILTRTELLKNRVSVRTQFADDLPIVIADKIQLQQVILNLVLNGIEAMNGIAEGQRELCVSSRKVSEIVAEAGKETIDGNSLIDRASTAVLIAVQDSGPGLGATELQRAFEPFYTTKPQGMGMGLAISRSIIEAHDGRLWATADAPRGAIFQFILPVRVGGTS
ncbi:MAG TPA: AAA family ATPase [Chthoniobacterales bacterium]|nr:AAA family ATPase [Chthoniobacterales bacterium]